MSGVSHSYGKNLAPILSNVDIAIEAGEMTAVTGPSGSGKSTLLNLLGLIDRPSTGSIKLDGIETGDLSDKQRTAIRATNIGFVFQAFHLIQHRSVVENVMLAGVYARVPTLVRRERAIIALQQVGLGGLSERFPSTLSGGERQRVAIARAVAFAPKVVLCDEPTGNLDGQSTRRILAVLRDLNDQGLSVLVITHDDEVAAACRTAYRLRDGVVHRC